ncbi:DUF2993 domain-containing protein [Mycobacterium sp.]|uniref:LmeA family phospholipid-binding protein n=1 Tax=Mycobacterium sp. TaxID=1785 RepID=UPI00127A786F|nr:DUF2993 domain-containing protein [Mycobacterium sp.]KAA8957710.1 MAG: DUF2993 domain-containing protein [Mycobacterium sp.]
MSTPQGPSGRPGPSPSESPTRRIPQGGPPNQPPPPAARLSDQPAATTSRHRFFGNPVSILLVITTVGLLIVASLIGAELYARHLADSKVAAAVSCEVQDGAKVSFAATPPVLWQVLTGHYTNISVQTAGNQVRGVKGMQISLDIRDIRLHKTPDSKGTIGALNGTISWSSNGIKQSIQDAIPVLGSFVTNTVTTDPSSGTIQLKGLIDSATVKPEIVDNGLSLKVVSLTALGAKMSTETVQKNLDDLTSEATKDYPLGIHADSVHVTDSGVRATFSTSDATIPASSPTGQNCFSGL